jgi:hypothetical protein
MLVMLVTKLLGAGGAAEERDDGPAEVTPDRQPYLFHMHFYTRPIVCVTRNGRYNS